MVSGKEVGALLSVCRDAGHHEAEPLKPLWQKNGRLEKNRAMSDQNRAHMENRPFVVSLGSWFHYILLFFVILFMCIVFGG